MNWVNSSIFYHIYPLGFCGAPMTNDNGETIDRILKVKEWIPHFSELGINALYLGPVFESSEHGYDTKDYFKIDRRLGSNEAFKEVCDACHKAGIRIVLDGVFNHVGREFWAFQDVQKHKWDSPYCDWFMNLNFNGRSPMNDDFWYEGWNGHYNLVKLNLRNPEVGNMILEAIFSWMDQFHIDGLRLDAADVMDKDFFKRLRHECKQKNPDFWLMGEVIHGDYKNWINEQMLDSTTNYECYKGIYSSHNDENYFEIGYSLNRQFGNGGIYKDLCLYNFVDNHDVNRLGSTLRQLEHLNNCYTLLFTMPGIPSIYYGSEVGMSGIKANGSDAGLRPCLSLEDVQSNELSEHIARLARIHKSQPALHELNYEQVCVRNKQLVYKRSAADQIIFTALNLDKEAYDISIPYGGPLTDLLTDTVYEAVNGNVEITMPPYSSLILCDKPADVEGNQPAKHAEKVKEAPKWKLLETIKGMEDQQQYYVYENEKHEKRVSLKKL